MEGGFLKRSLWNADPLCSGIQKALHAWINMDLQHGDGASDDDAGMSISPVNSLMIDLILRCFH